MKNVFISHSSKDKAIADVIVYSLEQEGISVWIAPRDIPGGTDYGASTMRGQRESDVLVLEVSKASNESDFLCLFTNNANTYKIGCHPFKTRIFHPIYFHYVYINLPYKKQATGRE